MALKALFQHMPVDTGAAFVVILHLDPEHESMMAQLLEAHTTMPVQQATDKMNISPNNVYLIPPDKDLSIGRGKLLLHTPAKGLHLPIDIFLNSLAESQAEYACAIILSGTGSDGTAGVRAVKGAGGLVLVQNPEDAQFDGMPKSALATGIVDRVLPATEMGPELESYIQQALATGYWPSLQSEPVETGEGYNRILATIRKQLDYNLFPYKESTLLRRITRRISLKHLNNINVYADYLDRDPDETIELFKDMLIGVTSFFRDPDSWAVLDESFFRKLPMEREKPVRIWVAGCSSGEEAYSLAMLMHEQNAREKSDLDYQIFATDIDAHALSIARKGFYPESIAADVSPQRLKTFFSKESNGYRVLPFLREHITFSGQDVTCDPPYSKMDLICCRNLFIYLQSDMQKRVLEIFHFALNPQGYLMLGSSESVGEPSSLFKLIHKKWRLYQRLNSARIPKFNLSAGPARYGRVDMQPTGAHTQKTTLRISDVARQMLMREYVPASVLINSKYEVLYYFGDTFEYLRHPSGEATNDLFAQLREGLATRVRSAVHQAFKEKEGVRVKRAKVKRHDRYVDVSFRVKSLAESDGGQGLLLISFEDEEPDQKGGKSSADVQMEDVPLVKQLEHDLNTTREELQNSIEELETSNEELKAAHEEAMSTNEELQSSNEELETSKEELQSFNEELNTVNTELQEKVLSLETANNDISNLIDSTRNASIFLDAEQNIKFFTPSSKQLFNLIESDIHRPLSDIVPKFDDPQLIGDITAVAQDGQERCVEVKDSEGNWYNRRILPYLTTDRQIMGTAITFNEITGIRNALEELKQSEHRYRGLFENMINGFALHEVICDRQGVPVDYTFLEANAAFARLTGLKPEEIVGSRASEMMPGIEAESADWIGRFGEVALNGKEIRFERYYERFGKWLSILAYSPEKGLFATVLEDITDRKQAEEELRISEQTLREAQEAAHIGSWIRGMDGSISWSDELYRIYGVRRGDFSPDDATVAALVYPDDRAPMEQWLKACAAGEEVQSIIFRCVCSDGSLRYIQRQARFVPESTEKPACIAGTDQDITEQKQFEEQFYQAQKMEALGTLVGGIAHDFNNILAGITGNIYLVKKYVQTTSEVQEKLDTIEMLAFRSANLIRQLLTFARKDKVSMQPLPLSTFLKETLKFLCASMPENIDIQSDISAEPVIIKGDATQIHQILMNLMNNARDAVVDVDHPYIKIKLETTTIEDVSAKPPGLKEGRYAHLSVEDNGCGIPEDEIEHLFEPFFTTKEAGKGTGLGLSMVFGAIQTHHGWVDVDSKRGKGSLFHVYLPVEEDESAAMDSSAEEPVTGHGETILLVDDEHYVIETGRLVLESLGYKVLEARNGLEAVEVFQANRDVVELVVMDLVMPTMSGVKAVEGIRKIVPDVKVLYCTGYDKDEALPKDISSGVFVLSKPYNVESFSKAVREQLDA